MEQYFPAPGPTKAEFDALNAQIGTDVQSSSTWNVSSGFISNYGRELRKLKNGDCYFCGTVLNVSSETTISEWSYKKIGTVPSGYRPKYDVQIPCLIENDNSDTHATRDLEITHGGDINIVLRKGSITLTTSHTIRVFTTYYPV